MAFRSTLRQHHMLQRSENTERRTTNLFDKKSTNKVENQRTHYILLMLQHISLTAVTDNLSSLSGNPFPVPPLNFRIASGGPPLQREKAFSGSLSSLHHFSFITSHTSQALLHFLFNSSSNFPIHDTSLKDG